MAGHALAILSGAGDAASLRKLLAKATASRAACSQGLPDPSASDTQHLANAVRPGNMPCHCRTSFAFKAIQHGDATPAGQLLIYIWSRAPIRLGHLNRVVESVTYDHCALALRRHQDDSVTRSMARSRKSRDFGSHLKVSLGQFHHTESLQG